MRIVQTTFGVFHHFELARELERLGHLDRIYSTWPHFRLRREGIPPDQVSTFPWIHTASFAAERAGLAPMWLTDHLDYANALAFDHWVLRRLRRRSPDQLPDCLIGIAGTSLKTGAWLQTQGRKFICDRGSSHQRYQHQIVQEEYRRWGVVQTSSDERDNVREDKIYQQADLIVAPSSFAVNSFITMGIPAQKLRRIPYGVRLDQFTPGSLQPENRFEVLFAGQCGLRKGVPYLLQAFAALKHPHKRLRIAGQVLSDLREVLKTLPQENVEFLGVIPQVELAKYMQESHLLVLPSIEDGFGMVVGQALASGCPVLCSENTGGPDIMTDGREGFIVPIRDALAISDRMQQLADDRQLWLAMRHAALERVRSIGGWNDYGMEWQSVLREVTQTSA